MAMAKALKERFEFEGAGDGLFDFDELASGEFFPAGADGVLSRRPLRKSLISARVKPISLAKRMRSTR